MNNLVFNNVASQLKTSIYGQAPNGSFEAIQIDSAGNIKTTITNASLTVAVSNPITIANSSLTVTVGSNAFTSSSVLNVTAIGTNSIMNNTDISNLKTASFLVYNNGLNTLTVSLQLSPTQNDIDYITDPNNQNLTIAPGTGQIIVVDLFAHYARLQYNQSRSSTTISVYFNGQA